MAGRKVLVRPTVIKASDMRIATAALRFLNVLAEEGKDFRHDYGEEDLGDGIQMPPSSLYAVDIVLLPRDTGADRLHITGAGFDVDVEMDLQHGAMFDIDTKGVAVNE